MVKLNKKQENTENFGQFLKKFRFAPVLWKSSKTWIYHTIFSKIEIYSGPYNPVTVESSL